MILMDTHAWWWAISDPNQLSERTQATIRKAGKGNRCVADITLWEFAMMVNRGRIDLKIPIEDWFDHALNHLGTRVIPINSHIARDSVNLPGEFHKDPADRLIVATARHLSTPLVTKDQQIRDYPHVVSIW